MSAEMNMSDQAVGAVMMSLQKSLMEQTDIVPVLKGFKFKLSEQGLVVMNPPLVKFDDEFEEQNSETDWCPYTYTIVMNVRVNSKFATAWKKLAMNVIGVALQI